MKEKIKPGIYRHFKGEEYYVLGTAKHSETQEELALYQHLGKGEELWVRPLSMFLEEVNRPEIPYKGPRFKFVRSD